MGLAAPLGHLTGQHQRVEVDDVAGLDRRAGLDKLAAGRQDGDAWPTPYLEPNPATGSGGAQIDRAEPLAFGQHQFGRDDVLAHRPNVLPGSD